MIYENVHTVNTPISIMYVLVNIMICISQLYSINGLSLCDIALNKKSLSRKIAVRSFDVLILCHADDYKHKALTIIRLTH